MIEVPEKDWTQKRKQKSKKNPWPDLFKAIYGNDTQKVKLLIETGHDVHEQNDLCLRLAAENVEITRLLLQAGARVNAQAADGDFALRCASYDVAKLLLEHGANVHLKNQNGYTALLSTSSVEIIKLLLDYGANIRDVNNWGENALMLQAMTPSYKYYQPIDTINFLINGGININAQDLYGFTALMHACYVNNFIIAQELLNLDADIQIKNAEGKMALDYAHEADNTELIWLLNR